ncbi:zinc finger HIT domain-containing protein 2 isoform X2 [Hoplias malabaricus]
MERMFRVPVSVRKLLTDITPKEEEFGDWTDPEPEPVVRDGISLPVLGSSEVLLTPCGSDSEGGQGSPRVCGLCLCKPALYTCPRCNVPFCGVFCYRSSAHSECSEEFYKECVSEELRSRAETQDEARRRIWSMQEILLRLRKSSLADGGMENVLKDHVEEPGAGLTESDTEALELLAKLAELQENGKEEEREEILEILQRLRQTQEGEEGDEDEDDEDLATKFSGLNVESLTEQQLWNLLPSRHRQRFQELLKGGGVSGLVEVWRPWWEKHQPNTTALIQELQLEEEEEESRAEGDAESEETEKSLETESKNPNKAHSQSKQSHEKRIKTRENVSNRAPPVSTKTPPLSQLCSSPSPFVHFSVVNTLYGFAFSLRLFNGDTAEPEFCPLVLDISEGLGSGRVFCSLSEALERAVSAAVDFDRQCPDAPILALSAVAHILFGESEDEPTGFALSALSQLRTALRDARKNRSGGRDAEEETQRRRCFLAEKKCVFFQSWVKENSATLRSSARETWREYLRRRAERERMDRERRAVEERGRKRRGKTLIQEI